jgi:hypothetical protein
LHDTDGDTSIHGPTFRGRIVGDGVLPPIALGCEAIWGNTFVNQFSHNAVGSPLRKLKIPLCAANIVGIPANLHVDTRISRQIRGKVVETFLRLGPELRRSRTVRRQ